MWDSERKQYLAAGTLRVVSGPSCPEYVDAEEGRSLMWDSELLWLTFTVIPKRSLFLTGNWAWQLNEKLFERKSYQFKVLRFLLPQERQPKPCSGVVVASMFKLSINQLPRNTHACPCPSLQAIHTQHNLTHKFPTPTYPCCSPAPCPSQCPALIALTSQEALSAKWYLKLSSVKDKEEVCLVMKQGRVKQVQLFSSYMLSKW